jgi:hypothetical protein
MSSDFVDAISSTKLTRAAPRFGSKIYHSHPNAAVRGRIGNLSAICLLRQRRRDETRRPRCWRGLQPRAESGMNPKVQWLCRGRCVRSRSPHCIGWWMLRLEREATHQDRRDLDLPRCLGQHLWNGCYHCHRRSKRAWQLSEPFYLFAPRHVRMAPSSQNDAFARDVP